MNKKGFLFVEAIVTTTILLSVLVVIYTGYNASIVEERNRLYYDDVEFIYKAIDISNRYIYDDPQTMQCGFKINTEADEIKNFIKDYHITSAYYIGSIYEVKKVINGDSNNCPEFFEILDNDNDTKQYLKTINPKNDIVGAPGAGIIVITSNETKSGQECKIDDYKSCINDGNQEMNCQCVTNYAWAYYFDDEVSL